MLGDNTGYGTTATAASVANFKKAGAEVVYQRSDRRQRAGRVAQPAARARRRRAGDRLLERLHRPGCAHDERARADRLGRASWPAIRPWARATSLTLLEKPDYWDKVYTVGYRSCSFDANGKLPPRMQAFVDEVKGKIELQRHPLWWVMVGGRCGDAGRRGRRQDRIERSGQDHRLLEQSDEVAGPVRRLRLHAEKHNGYPTEEIVMSAANSQPQRRLHPGARLRRLMLQSIISYGLAMGAIVCAHRHRLQRDVQRLAGVQLHRGRAGHAGRRVRALFINRLGLPGICSGSSPTLACCAVFGVVTEFVAVRPVLAQPGPAPLRALDAGAVR